MEDEGQKVLDEAYEQLEREVPPWLAKTLRWLRDPKSRWVRIPVGLLCIVAGFFWFLPVVGLEFLPIGLLLLAQDIPFLRKPTGHLIIWLVRQWIRFRNWWARKIGWPAA